MPELAKVQNYGEALPDQVERISKLFDAHLELIGDVADLISARIALEREYAGKLQSLSRKALDKKAKMEVSFILGDDPTKTWDHQSLKQSTLGNLCDEMISAMASSAQDHTTLADALSSQVVDALRSVQRQNEETKKKEMQFFQKLLSDRDRIYAERLKSKQKYDEECAEVESFRQKQGRTNDDRHADRAAKQAEQQRNEMMNSKNVYLISNCIANRVKSKFYQDDLPQLENEFQTLQGQLVQGFVGILQTSQRIQTRHLETLTSRVTTVNIKLEQINIPKDQDLFIQYNIRPFIPLDDWGFEPCPVHYDIGTMSVEAAPKVFIQNKLRRCREKLQELNPLIDSKRVELSHASPSELSSSAGSINDRALEAAHQLAFYTTSEVILNAELDAIVAAIGDDEGSLKPHSFKSSPFSIPTQCAYCKSSIWGLSKQGKTCKACGLSVHAKCELKVTANCEQTTEHQPSLFRKSSNAVSRTSAPEPSPTMAPSASSFVHPPPEEPIEERPQAKVLFDFTATSEFELGVHEGMVVQVLEPDDGSGWVKVVGNNGTSGLVPASYLAMDGEESAGDEAGRQGTNRARAIYAYHAQTADELDLEVGQILELSSGPNGGQNFGNGWWEGFTSQGTKGIFPSNYVEIC